MDIIAVDFMNDIATEFRELPKETCKGANKCLWCKLAGHHSQTQEERTLLIKQASIGLMVIFIIITVAVGTAYYLMKMVRIL